jgi:phasin family protein
MFSFPEQLSTAHKAQFDTQIDFMRNLTAQAFATAGQVFALNISTSRASVERAAGTVRQLFTVSDPRDLFTLGAQTQEELSALFNYSRELFDIASGARVELARAAAARPAPQPEPEQAIAVEQPVPAAATTAAEDEQAESPRKLKVAADKPAAAPRAKARPMAKAVSKATGVAVELPQPLAANVDSTGSPAVKLDTLPPAADVLALKPKKSQRKK